MNFQLRQEGIKVTDILIYQLSLTSSVILLYPTHPRLLLLCVYVAEDFSTGVVLAALLTVLAQEPVKINQKPRMRIHYMENVLKCLKFMQQKGMKLVNVSSEGILYIVSISPCAFLTFMFRNCR